MEPTLSNLKPPKGSRKKHVRVGRGMGSKLGKTAGKGNKGQKSRRGYQRRAGFEGGQMPLHRRMPKRGFINLFRREFVVVNVGLLNGFTAGERITPEELSVHGLVRGGYSSLKVLGEGELSVALTVCAHAFSRTAEEKITRAGGKVEILQ
jgi:large subunit ribosomal protein L15